MQIIPEKELYSTVIRQYPDIPRIPLTNILKVGQNGMSSVSGSEGPGSSLNKNKNLSYQK